MHSPIFQRYLNKKHEAGEMHTSPQLQRAKSFFSGHCRSGRNEGLAQSMLTAVHMGLHPGLYLPFYLITNYVAKVTFR